MKQIKEVDILAIGVHPDDVELSCAGTLLKHIDMGYSVGICDLTEGELGTRGSIETRYAEAENAAYILGASFRTNLQLPDGFMKGDRETLVKICEIIRLSKPKIVICNAIHDRHPDHGRSAKIVSDASFYSGLSKIEIKDKNGNIIAPHRPKAVYHYIQDRTLNPDFAVDISNYIDKKMEAILAFRTQFYEPGMQGPQTPISGEDFLDFIKSKNRVHARDIGAKYAEGFTVERIPGVDDIVKLS